MNYVMDLDIILELQAFDLDQELLLNNNEYVLTELLEIINNFTNTEYDQFLNLEDKKVVLTKEEWNRIPYVHCQNEELECGICLESFIKDEQLKVLNCQHLFHPGCIKTWLMESKTTCPICRKEQRI